MNLVESPQHTYVNSNFGSYVCMIFNDDARLGRPSTSTTDENIEAVKKIILNNCRITIREVADDVGLSFGQAIYTDVLGM